MKTTIAIAIGVTAGLAAAAGAFLLGKKIGFEEGLRSADRFDSSDDVEVLDADFDFTMDDDTLEPELSSDAAPAEASTEESKEDPAAEPIVEVVPEGQEEPADTAEEENKAEPSKPKKNRKRSRSKKNAEKAE